MVLTKTVVGVSGAYAKVCGGFEWGSKMLGVNNMAVGLALLKAASRDEY